MGDDQETGTLTGGAGPRRSLADIGPGCVLDDRFELLAPLGKGGMGIVFEAMHVTLQEKRAVKVLPKYSTSDQRAIQRFLAEARTTAKLKHPNIVEVSDAGVSADGYRFIAMELLRGETLREWIKKTNEEEKGESYIQELVDIVRAVCGGLQVAHESSVIHRDLKPANIFLHHATGDAASEEMIPKILDFGIAKRTDLESQNLTLPGDIIGTTEYVSPEQIRGQEPDIRSDIYALGLVIYEALTGQTPFRSESQGLAFSRALDPKFKVIAPSKINSKVPKHLDRICLKAIERDPGDRYQSAIALADALAGLSVVESKKPTIETDAEKISGSDSSGSPSSGKYTAMAIIGVAALALIITGVVLLSRRDSDESVVEASSGAAGSSEKQVAPTPRPPEPEPAAASNRVEESEPRHEQNAPGKAKRKPAQTERRREVKVNGTPPPGTVTQPDPEPQPSQPKPKEERVKELVAQGNQALDAMSYDDAERLFDQAVREQPKNAQAWYGLGRVALEKREYKEAAHRIRVALSHRNNGRWRVTLGQALLAANRKDAAIQEWQRVVEEQPQGSRAVKIARSLLSENGVQPD